MGDEEQKLQRTIQKLEMFQFSERIWASLENCDVNQYLFPE